jgi:AcrR family transcriptional regulator
MPPPSDPSSPQRRDPLSRPRVVRAAITYIDAHGLGQLTMRRLAATLGVEAMSLYKHVSGRDHLLDAMVDALLADLHGHDDVQPEAAFDWRDYLRRVAHGVRAIAQQHPQIFPLVATRPPAAPWIQPPLRSLEWIESFLRTLRSHGFGDRQAVDAYKAFNSFLLGHLLLEVANQQVPINPEDRADPPDEEARFEAAAVALDGYPTVAGLARLLAEDTASLEFASALESLLVRLSGLVDGQTISGSEGTGG